MSSTSKISISEPAPAPIAALREHADARWRTEWRAFGAFNMRGVFTAPDGVEYVRAQSGRVDLEVPMKTPGLRPLQLRRLDAGADNPRSSRRADGLGATGADPLGSDHSKE